MLALVITGAAAPQGPANTHMLAAAERADGSGGPPLTKLRDLEPRYKSLEDIRKLFNKTMMSAPQDGGFPASSCKSLTYGSTLATWDKMEYQGPQDNTSIIFNIGSYKTGSTSADAAARQLGLKSCKIGWGEAGGNAGVAFSATGTLAYKACPVWDDSNSRCEHSIDIFRGATHTCQMLGDAPWPFAWPTAMRAYPQAKFILSRQKTCADWVFHVQGLWNAGYGRGDQTTCWCLPAATVLQPV